MRTGLRKIMAVMLSLSLLLTGMPFALASEEGLEGVQQENVQVENTVPQEQPAENNAPVQDAPQQEQPQEQPQQQQAPEQQAPEQPAQEQPKQEEPKQEPAPVQEPAQEQPKEEPKQDPPAQEQPQQQPTQEQPVQQPVQEEPQQQPQQDPPAQEQPQQDPVQEQPQQQPAQEQPAQQPTQEQPVQQEPAQDQPTQEVLEPVIPVEPEEEEKKETLEGAIAGQKTAKDPMQGPTPNDESLTSTFRFDTAKGLDKLEVIIRVKNANIKSLELNDFGSAPYSVYKYFKVVHLDEKGETQTLYPAMPVAENLNGSEKQKVRGLDQDYHEFPNTDPNDDAVFLKEYRIIFHDGIAAGKSLKLVVNSIMESIDESSAVISVNAVCHLNGETANAEIGETRFAYGIPEKEQEVKEEAKEEGGEETPEDNKEPAEEPEEEKTEQKEDVQEEVQPDLGMGVKKAPALKTGTPRDVVGTSRITVKVVFKEDETPLAGSEIMLIDSDAKEKKATTDENGTAVFDELFAGTYTLSQVSVPDGYVRVTEEQTVTVEDNMDFEYTFKNAALPTTGGMVLKVVKSGTDEAIFGAAFGVYTETGALLMEISTGEDGTVTLDGLQPGSYTLKQVSTENGYLAHSEDITVPVTAGTLTKVDVKNSPEAQAPKLGAIGIIVRENDTNNPVPEVEFTIYQGEEAKGTAKTSVDGIASFEQLEFGKYTIRLTGLPEGFESIDFSAEDDVQSAEDAIVHTIKLTRTLVEGVVGTIKVILTNNATETGIPGISFVVKDGNNAIVSNLVTDENGEAVTDELPGGTYIVEQKTLPDEYAAMEPAKNVAILRDGEQTVEFTMTPKTAIAGKLQVTVTNAETKEPVEGAVFTIKDAEDAEVGTFTSGADGVALSEELGYGSYTVTVTTIPDGYEEITYSATVAIEDSITYTAELALKPKAPDIPPPDPEITAFTPMQFIPTETEAVPASPFTYSLGNYELTYNDDIYFAERVEFTIKPVTDKTDFRALFEGEVENYQVSVVLANGRTEAVPKTNDDVSVVDFDSTKLPVYDENGELIEGAAGFMPEGTQIIRLTVYGPKNGFKATDVHMTEAMPETFNEYSYTVDTQVYETGTADPVKSGTETGTVKVGSPEAIVTLTPSATVDYVNNTVSVAYDLKNETSTTFTATEIAIEVPAQFSPQKLTLGTWTNYEGEVGITTTNEEGENILTSVDILTSEAITLPGDSITSIRLIPAHGFNGTEAITGLTLEGTFKEVGEMTVVGTFRGVVTEDLITEAEANAVIQIETQPTPTPTPTPEVTPIPEVTPTPTPDPGQGGGGGGGVVPPSGPTNTPAPTDVPMELSAIELNANTSSIGYGDSALIYARNLRAVGMKTGYYYVLHLMIPTGLQVRSIELPDFGGNIRASLVYNSGTADLGTYGTASTINLTEREGSNIRYIALQMRGVTEAATTGGEVTLMVKNISSRDRVATLQGIVSIRDESTKVLQQNSDKYNVSLAGPKVTVTAAPTKAPTGSPSYVGGTTTGDNTGNTTTTGNASSDNVSSAITKAAKLAGVDNTDVQETTVEDLVNLLNNEMNDERAMERSASITAGDDRTEALVELALGKTVDLARIFPDKDGEISFRRMTDEEIYDGLSDDEAEVIRTFHDIYKYRRERQKASGVPDGIFTVWPLLQEMKEVLSAENVETKSETYPLLMPKGTEVYARNVNTERIPVYEVTQERIMSFGKKIPVEEKMKEIVRARYGTGMVENLSRMPEQTPAGE